MKSKHLDAITRKVFKMELGNPIITTLVGLVVFYIGLKMFSGGISMGNIDLSYLYVLWWYYHVNHHHYQRQRLLH